MAAAALLSVASGPAASQTGAKRSEAPAAPSPVTTTPGYRNSFQCIPATTSPAPTGFQIISPGKDSPAEPSAMCSDQGAKSGAATPGKLVGETKPLNAGMVVPAVQSARDYTPAKKPSPKPDSTPDDCMSCDD